MGEGRVVKLWASTWLRDSHGLFDYETQLVETDKFETTRGGTFFRVDDNVDFQPDSESHLQPLDSDPLVQLLVPEGTI